MVYMAADNNLEGLALADLNQMEAAGSSPNVTVVAQVDTQTIPFNGSTTAKRIQILSEGVVNYTLVSPTLPGGDLGEVNMASPVTLQDFVNWGLQTYPAEKRLLILWDHGGQWEGYGSDDTSGGGIIDFSELKSAFDWVYTATADTKLDLVGFDACLMASIELDQMLAPYANYRVASSELEIGGLPISGTQFVGGGWNYRDSLNDLVANTAMTVSQFGQSLCNRFIAMKNAGGVTNQTLSLVDLAQVPALVLAVDAFAGVLRSNMGAEFLGVFAPSRRYASEYGRVSLESPARFVDLRHFASQVASRTSLPAVASAANAVVGAVDAAVVHRVQGVHQPNHGGVSIYYPNCGVCDPSQSAYRSRVDLPATTQWDEYFLEYQTTLATDGVPPGVTIVSLSSTFVSQFSPVNVGYNVTGSDLANESVVISQPAGGNSSFIYGEADLSPSLPGNWTITWDSLVFAVTDGGGANWVPAMSLQAGTTLYITVVRHVANGGAGPSRDVYAILDLRWATGTGVLLGLYQSTPQGALASIPVYPGDWVNFLFPILNKTTGVVTYAFQPVSLVVPAGGVGNLAIYQAPMPAGPVDLEIFVEDYAENLGYDLVTLTVF